MLCLLARKAGAPVYVFADSSMRKSEQSDAVLSFIRIWKERSSASLTDLLFDSELTTYANRPGSLPSLPTSGSRSPSPMSAVSTAGRASSTP